VWVAEVDRDAGGGREVGMVRRLCSLIPGEGTHQMLWQFCDGAAHGVLDSIGGAVPVELKQ
jgi:hypothetical protein